jgi:NAD(P)H-flavin reductase
MVKRLEVELIEKELLDTDLYKVRFALPAGERLEFLPGQFMSIAVDGFIRRSFSFSNPPSQNTILETYADVSPRGPAAKFFDNIQVGEKAAILAPLGHFLYKPSDIPVYFFAAGTGIVPFLSMIHHELEVIKSGREIHLVLGVRNQKRLSWEHELTELTSQYPNFHYQSFLSQPEGEWQGRVGRITDAVPEISDTEIQAYICGGKAAIDAVETGLLERGVDNENIFYERYY